MDKIRFNIDDLTVESFETTAGQPNVNGGTVFGRSTGTTDYTDCWGNCDPSNGCNPTTVDPTCPQNSVCATEWENTCTQDPQDINCQSLAFTGTCATQCYPAGC